MSPALATHSQAGSIELHRLAVRVAEPTAVVFESTSVGAGEHAAGDARVELAITPGDSVASLDATVCNASDRPLRLQSLVLGFEWKDHGLESFRYLRQGWQSWSFTGSRELTDEGEPEFPSGPWLRGLHHAVGDVPGDRRGWWESDWMTAVGAPSRGPTLVAGVLERGESFGVVYLRRRGFVLSVEVELRVDAELSAGETRVLEPVRVALGTDAPALLEQFAQAQGRGAGARTASPFMAGWCSWYHFFDRVSEADVLRNLEALAGSRDELPVEVVQIDDGYQSAIGDWLTTNEKFPRGIARLADEIRAAGFTAGLWTAPFCLVPESRLFSDHPDWLLQDEDGPFRGLLHAVWSQSRSVHVLDTSQPAVVRHLEDLFRALAEMGFHYLKLDFLYTVAMESRSHDPSVGRAQRLRRGLEAIRRGAGEEAFLLGCGCPLGAAVGVVDGMRIGPDVAPHWFADPRAKIRGIEETVPSTRSALRSILVRAFTHRRLWLNDPDCLMARSDDTKLSRDEREALATAIAATGGMLVFSDDVPTLAKDDRLLVAKTAEIAKAVDRLGLPGLARIPEPLAREIPRDVVVDASDSSYVGLINAEDRAVARSVERASLGVPAGFDGGERLLGVDAHASGSSFEVDLPEHSGTLVRTRHPFPLAVFCDFDGTFSIQDVGSTLAIRHAGDLRGAVWKRYEKGEIRAWDYNMQVLHGLPVSRVDVDAFLHTVELDPGARDLLAWCADRGIPFRVLSDGFDYNLNRLQDIHRVRFAYTANELRFDRGRWRIRAGRPPVDCSCGTGTCKRTCIDEFRAYAPDAQVVHIGNGRVSDTCGALAADIAFAKDSLAAELDSRGVPYTPFSTLLDVVAHLESLLGQR